MGWPWKAGKTTNYADVNGYRPLLAVAACTGDILMARLGKDWANNRFYTRAIVATCRDNHICICLTITARPEPEHGNLIDTIPEADWTPIPYWPIPYWMETPMWPKLNTHRWAISPTPCQCFALTIGSTPSPAPIWAFFAN